ncbi:MAG TPA: hypothetical protein VHD37_00610 [Candidatus Paceibacterota bacterium]|nr:hypothetical protein [Candidatus Paceibacterota bacterium]
MTQTKKRKPGKSPTKKAQRPKGPTGLLDKIAAALAAIKPDQIMTPPLDAKEGPGIELLEMVGAADDYLKRLFSYHLSEQNKLNAAVERVQQAVRDTLNGRGTGAMSKVKEILQERKTSQRYVELLRSLFWAEAWQRIPGLNNSDYDNVAISSDWNFYGRKKQDLHGFSHDLFSGGLGADAVFGGLGGRPNEGFVEMDIGELLAHMFGGDGFDQSNRRGPGSGMFSGMYRMGPNGFERVNEGKLPPEFAGLGEVLREALGGGTRRGFPFPRR